MGHTYSTYVLVHFVEGGLKENHPAHCPFVGLAATAPPLLLAAIIGRRLPATQREERVDGSLNLRPGCVFITNKNKHVRVEKNVTYLASRLCIYHRVFRGMGHLLIHTLVALQNRKKNIVIHSQY
jgi:hypothetical protein